MEKITKKHTENTLTLAGILILVIALASCTGDFEDFNTDSKKPVEVPPGNLLSYAQKALADQNFNTSREQNNFNLFAQYFAQTTYTNESNYDVLTRNVGNNLFDAYYTKILSNIRQAALLIDEQQPLNPEQEMEKQNQLAIIELLEVFAWQQLVDIFGDIPYIEALDIYNTAPVYDTGEMIYSDLAQRLDAAISLLNPSYGSFGEDDLFYRGNVALWKKMGYSLKVKLAIMTAHLDESKARNWIEEAAPQVFQPGESLRMHYPGGNHSTRFYDELVQSGRNDFLPANTLVDIMNEMGDPRMAAYFSRNGETFQGGIFGETNPFWQFSHIGEILLQPDYAPVLLDHTYIAFLLAEATELGFSTGKTAGEWYESAIRSSMNEWNVDEEQAMSYLHLPEVIYAGTLEEKMQKIALQSWIALYSRGLDGWTIWRRHGYPELNLPPAPDELADGDVPRRHTWPTSEQTLNRANYEQATQRLGGDRLSNRIFWD